MNEKNQKLLFQSHRMIFAIIKLITFQFMKSKANVDIVRIHLIKIYIKYIIGQVLRRKIKDQNMGKQLNDPSTLYNMLTKNKCKTTGSSSQVINNK